jgi:hypothetical protein
MFKGNGMLVMTQRNSYNSNSLYFDIFDLVPFYQGDIDGIWSLFCYSNNIPFRESKSKFLFITILCLVEVEQADR